MGDKISDAILPFTDAIHIQQRLADPLADAAFPHGRNGLVKHTQQGTFDLATQGFGQLKIATGGGVECHEFAQAVDAQS